MKICVVAEGSEENLDLLLQIAKKLTSKYRGLVKVHLAPEPQLGIREMHICLGVQRMMNNLKSYIIVGKT